MKKYVFVAPPYNNTSAGIEGCYKLARDLDQLVGCRLVVQGQSGTAADDEIVIYPDCIPGNPLGARNVVRFLWMWAGYFGAGTDSDFPESEYMYYYVPDYVHNGRNSENILTVPMLREERFPHRPLSERSGSCYMAVKFQDYFGNTPMGLPDDCVRIDRSMDIAKLFAEKHTLITFDNSAVNIEAALAGMHVEYRYNHTFTDRYKWGDYWDYADVPGSYAKQKEMYPSSLQQFIARTQERFL